MLEAWLQYLGASILVFAGGWSLVRFGDAIGEQTGLGRVWAGVLLLATATSLPELVTGITAVRGIDSPDLAAGGAFGANSLNLLTIAVLGIKWRHMLHSPNRETKQMGISGIVIVVMAAAILALGRPSLGVPELVIRILPGILVVTYVATALWTVGMLDALKPSRDGIAVHPRRLAFRRPSSELLKNIGGYLVAVAIVTGAGIWLANAADSVANAMGWSSSYVGAQFLPISTTLPEISVAIASLRIGAPEMAISNLLGSNMFNIGIVLAADSFAYTKGAFFTDIASVHLIAAVAAVSMTVIFIPGLVAASRPFVQTAGAKSLAKIGVYAWMSLLIFAMG